MDREDTLATLSDHVVICNCNANVGKIVEELHTADVPVPLTIVLVIQDLALWHANPDWHPESFIPESFIQVEGSPTEEAVLERVHIGRARAAVVLADPSQGNLADARTTLIALAIEHGAPAVHTVVELLRPGNRVHLMATEVDEVVCVSEIKEKLISQSCVTPWVKNVFRHILAAERSTAKLYLREVPEGLRGESFRELAGRAIAVQAPFVIAGFLYGQRGEQQAKIVISPPAWEEPGKDTPLEAGDQLVLIARAAPRL